MKVSILYHSETGNTRKMADLVLEGALRVEGIEARAMSLNEIDEDYIADSSAVIFGSPTYCGMLSWQIKKFLDTTNIDLAGKLCGVFASQNWPGGGGADFTELTIIAAALVHGMLVYSGGGSEGHPFLHFGAVSRKAPDEELYRDRCLHLGEVIAKKAKQLFEN